MYNYSLNREILGKRRKKEQKRPKRKPKSEKKETPSHFEQLLEEIQVKTAKRLLQDMGVKFEKTPSEKEALAAEKMKEMPKESEKDSKSNQKSPTKAKEELSISFHEKNLKQILSRSSLQKPLVKKVLRGSGMKQLNIKAKETLPSLVSSSTHTEIPSKLFRFKNLTLTHKCDSLNLESQSLMRGLGESKLAHRRKVDRLLHNIRQTERRLKMRHNQGNSLLRNKLALTLHKWKSRPEPRSLGKLAQKVTSTLRRGVIADEPESVGLEPVFDRFLCELNKFCQKDGVDGKIVCLDKGSRARESGIRRGNGRTTEERHLRHSRQIRRDHQREKEKV